MAKIKENQKSIISIAAAVFGAIILSLSFILIVNGSVDVDGDAPQDMEFEYGVDSAISYDLNDIRNWFTLSPEPGSQVAADATIPDERIEISIDPTPSLGSYSTIGGFSFNPTIDDIGKTFTVEFNVQGNDGEYIGDTASHTFQITVIYPRNPTPSIQIDYANETLTGFDSSATYTINGTTYQNISAPIAIETDWLSSSLSIIQIGDDNNSDSPAQTLPIPARPTAPVLDKTDETSFGLRDGQITGLDIEKKYEYSSNGTTWTEYGPGLTIIYYLSPRTYYVRLAATSTDFASTATEKTIAAGAIAYPLVFTGGQLKYNGNEAIAYGVLPADSYTVSGNTLNLSGVNFTTTAEIALDLSGVSGARLNFSGTNTITSTYSGANASYAVKATGSLLINGTGSLTATAGNATSTTSAGIYNAGSLFIQSGTVTAIGGNGTGSASYGISATADVSITGGSVTATGQASQGYGINAGGMINIQSGVVTAAGGISALNKSPSKPISYSWIATQGSGDNNYVHTYSDKTVTITTQTGVDTPTVTYNKYDDFDGFDFRYSLASGVSLTGIEYDDTTLEKGNDKDYNISENIITVLYDYLVTLPNTGTPTLTLITSDGVNPTVAITFDNEPATNANGLVLNDGKLQIGGSNATEADLGGGSYSWNGTTKTLTLNNVNFQTSAEIALDLTAVLNVKFNLIGTNTFTSIYNGTSSTYGIATTGTITIEGTGSLSVTGGTSTSGNSNGVTGNVTVNGGEFNATGGTATGNSNGVTGNVTVNGGNMTVQGDSKASSSSPTVNVAKYNWYVSKPLITENSVYPFATPNFTDAYYIQIITQTGVNPETPTYNKFTDFDGLEIDYSLANGETLSSISNGDTTLTPNVHYTISGYTVTFLYDYLKTLPGTTATLTFNTSGTTDPTVRITLDNTLPTNEYGLVLTENGQLQINNVNATREQLGGGSYSYSGNTLTITDVNFATDAQNALDLSAVDDVNLVINGENSFISRGVSFTTAGIRVDAFATLTISGTGSLTAKAEDTNFNGFGIDAENGFVVLNGGNFSLKGKTHAIRGTATTTINIPKYSWTADLSNDFYPYNALTVGTQKAITITSLTAVSPTAADVNLFSTPADIVVTYSVEYGTTLDSITNGENTLRKNTDYTIVNNIVTIKGSYLRTLSVGTNELKFNTSDDENPTVTLSVVNRNPAYTYYDLSEFTEDPDITVTSGQTVVITGTKGSSGSPANFGLTFNVEAGGNVIWDYAIFTTSAEYAVTVNGHSGTKGTFEMTDGAINAIRTNSVYALSNYVNLTIKDGTVSGASSSNLAFAISNNPGANLTINDGIISANSSIWSYGIWNNGTVLINGGIIAATGNGNGSDALINDGTMTVKGDATVIGITNIYAGTIPVTFSENAVSILYDNTMTNPVLYSTNGLTQHIGTAVWNTVGGKHGISWRNGTSSRFFEISGVTTTTSNVSANTTIDISFIKSQPTFTVTDSNILTVTGENTSADFYLYFVMQDTSEVIWDGAKFITTYSQAVSANADSVNPKFTMNSGVIASSVGIGLFTNVSNIKIGGTLIAEQPIVGDIHNSPDLVGDYVLITLPATLGTYTQGTSTDLIIEPAGATAVWDKKSGVSGISWENGTNTGFIEIPGAATIPAQAPPEIDLGEPDADLPPKKSNYSPSNPQPDRDPDDNANEESDLNLKVNGEMTDTSVALPTEPGDKTADVKVNGRTFETYSLTAAEAIADGEITEAFVSPSGAIAGVTVGGNVIAGANGTTSLNSASTIEALKTAAEAATQLIAQTTTPEDGETIEKPLITISTAQDVTVVSDNTIEKIVAVSSEYGVDARIQKTQYSVDENEKIDELIYRITIPVEETNIRDIRLGAEFNTTVVEASKIAFEKTFGNTDCAGFALTQKETFGTQATIQVKASAIGFKAKTGDTVYVAIFNPNTGEFTQIEGTVGENGFISFKTDKSGVIIISATSFIK